MLRTGSQFLEPASWLIFAPGVASLITVLTFGFIGEDLQRTLDPQLLRKQMRKQN